VSHLTAITDWLKEQPYTRLERHVCGSEILETELVQAIEREVDEFQQHAYRVKTVTMQVKPHLLYKVDVGVQAMHSHVHLSPFFVNLNILTVFMKILCG
jgi:hypothetical protein